MESRKVLVTGGSGFIASHLCRLLLKLGYKVAITTRYRAKMKHPRLVNIWDDLEIIEADIRNRASLEAIWKWNGEMIFHLAAYNHVGQSWEHYEECYDVNAMGTANVFHSAPPDCRIVYVSSSEVYGLQDQTPWTESMTPRPQSPYAVTKYAGELHAAMMATAGRNVGIVRPFNCYGPWQSEKAFIPEMITKMLRGDTVVTTEGKQTREFLYVDDIVRGIHSAGLVREVGPFNLSCGIDISISDLVEKLAKATHTCSRILKTAKTRDNEIWKMVASNFRAEEALNWTPVYSLDDGLNRTVEWYKEYMDA